MKTVYIVMIGESEIRLWGSPLIGVYDNLERAKSHRDGAKAKMRKEQGFDYDPDVVIIPCQINKSRWW